MVVRPVADANVAVGNCGYRELALKEAGNPSGTGSNPALGDGCASSKGVGSRLDWLVRHLGPPRLAPGLFRRSSDACARLPEYCRSNRMIERKLIVGRFLNFSDPRWPGPGNLPASQDRAVFVTHPPHTEN